MVIIPARAIFILPGPGKPCIPGERRMLFSSPVASSPLKKITAPIIPGAGCF
jgi:hypothetical protein